MMNPDDIALIEKYLDGTLSPDESTQLESLLRESAEARAKLRSLATIDFGLQTIAEGDPVSNQLPSPDIENTRSQFPLMLVMAAMVVLLIGVATLMPRGDDGPETIARISRLAGPIHWTGAGGRVSNDLVLGAELPGGTIEGLSPGSWVELEFLDGSTVILKGDSRLIFSDFGQKQLHLIEGSISADVNPQPSEKPMLIHTRSATLKVLGTQFNVTTDIASTALDVNEGKVNILRLSDGQNVDVPAQHRIVAASDQAMNLKPIPDSVLHWNSKLDLRPAETFGKWAPKTETKNASLGLVPYVHTNRSGERIPIFVGSILVSGGNDHPVILQSDTNIVVRGRVNSPFGLAFGVIVRDAKGGFGGSFLKGIPPTDFQADGTFELAFSASELILDSDLEGLKDELLPNPLNALVETFWCASIDNPDGFQIHEVEFIPAQTERDESSQVFP